MVSQFIIGVPIWVTCVLLSTVVAYNLSPTPHIQYTGLSFVGDGDLDHRASFFGYSIIMIDSSRIYIGAPRANLTSKEYAELKKTDSELEALYEPGGVYQCTLDNVKCTRIEVADALEPKHGHQWLGAAIDISMTGKDDDQPRLVACAPRHHIWNENYHRSETMPGACFWTSTSSTTSTSAPPKFQQFNEDLENVQGGVLAARGIRVHTLPDDGGVLIGAPGFDNNRGTVMLYRWNGDQTIRQTARVLPDWSMGSYFGYAVASGHFANDSHVSHVASAPRGDRHWGIVHVFDWLKSDDVNDVPIGIRQTLRSEQRDSYYGYALAADDFNGDGCTDLVVAAPFYVYDDGFDNGAVYVYNNDKSGKLQYVRMLKPSTSTKSGRFGLAVAQLGDLNGDGWRDLAVGAPHEDDGAVYIFLGTADGLSGQPSQVLRVPSERKNRGSRAFFGMGLSRGVDVNGDGLPDLAIGSPNAGHVHVHLALGVVEIVVELRTDKTEIGTDDGEIEFDICYAYKSSMHDQPRVSIDVGIQLDTKFKRLTIGDQEGTNFTVDLTKQMDCKRFRALLHERDEFIFNPIDIQVFYVDKGAKTNRYKSNSEHWRNVQKEIWFQTDCKRPEDCETDIKIIEQVDGSEPHLVGKDTTLNVRYTVNNAGQKVFKPRLSITTPANVSYVNCPSICRCNDIRPLVCDLGTSLASGMNATDVVITLDTSRMRAVSGVLCINAILTSQSGRNPSYKNSYLQLKIRESSVIQATDRTPSQQFVMPKKRPSTVPVQHLLEVRNMGPSILDEVVVVVSVPLVFSGETSEHNIIKKSDVNVTCTFEKRNVPSVIIDESNEHWTSKQPNCPQAIETAHQPNTFWSSCMNGSLECVHVMCSLANFATATSPSPIRISIKMTLNVKEVDAGLGSARKKLALQTRAHVFRASNTTGDTVCPRTIFSGVDKVDSRAYSIGGVLGVLGLVMLITGLYMFGFFRRDKRAELEKLMRPKRVLVQTTSQVDRSLQDNADDSWDADSNFSVK